MIPVQFRPAASQDVLEAVDWYEAQRPGLGGISLKISIAFCRGSKHLVVNFLVCIGTLIVRSCVSFRMRSFSRLMRIEHLWLLLPICVEKANVGNGAYDV